MVKHFTFFFVVFGWLGENPDVIHGFPGYMPLSKLGEPYLVNDKLHVGVEFEFISVTNYC